MVIAKRINRCDLLPAGYVGYSTSHSQTGSTCNGVVGKIGHIGHKCYNLFLRRSLAARWFVDVDEG